MRLSWGAFLENTPAHSVQHTVVYSTPHNVWYSGISSHVHNTCIPISRPAIKGGNPIDAAVVGTQHSTAQHSMTYVENLCRNRVRKRYTSTRDLYAGCNDCGVSTS